MVRGTLTVRPTAHNPVIKNWHALASLRTRLAAFVSPVQRRALDRSARRWPDPMKSVGVIQQHDRTCAEFTRRDLPWGAEKVVDILPTDAELAGESAFRSPAAARLRTASACSGVKAGFRPVYAPLALAFAMPSRCRLRIMASSNSAKLASLFIDKTVNGLFVSLVNTSRSLTNSTVAPLPVIASTVRRSSTTLRARRSRE